VKTCRICNIIQPLDAFSRTKGNSDGLDSRCRKCRASVYQTNKLEVLERAKARYIANPDLFRARKRESNAKHTDSRNARRRSRWDHKSRALQNNTRHSIRSKCFDTLGGKCLKCEITDYDVLCVDHIEDDGKQERESGVASITIWRKVIRSSNPGRYQLLCFNCNLRKSILRDRIGTLTKNYKKCATCSSMKDTSFFKCHSKHQDGRYYECRSCTRNRVISLKAVAITKVGMNKCSSCDEHDLITLTFDHVNEDGHLSRQHDGLGEVLYRRVINGTVDTNRFQVLCLNCNLKKHKRFSGAKLSVSGFESLKEIHFINHSEILNSNTAITDPTEFNFKDSKISITNSIPDMVTFLQKWHYSGYGRSGSIHIVCHINGEIAAVAKFASAIRQEVVTSLGLKYGSVLELDRFCINPKYQKKNFGSFFLAASSKIVKSVRTDLTALVSFADPAQGHQGTIYRASNWTEAPGRLRNDYQYQDVDGKIIHKKTIFDSAKVRGLKELQYASNIGLIKIKIPAKRKFVFRY